MNMQDAIGEFRDEVRREQAHIARETNQIHLVLVEHRSDLAIVNFAFKAFRRNHARANTPSLGALDSRGTLAITDNNGKFCVGDAARRHRFRQSLEVRAAAAQQHANALPHKRETLAYRAASTKPAAED